MFACPCRPATWRAESQTKALEPLRSHVLGSHIGILLVLYKANRFFSCPEPARRTILVTKTPVTNDLVCLRQEGQESVHTPSLLSRLDLTDLGIGYPELKIVLEVFLRVSQVLIQDLLQD